MEDPMPEQVEAPEGGCGPWEAHAGASSRPDRWTREEGSPRQGRFAGRTCDPVGDPTLEQFAPEVKDDDESGPSREQEESEPEVITRSLSLSELRDMRKDFSHLPGEHIITWLLRCWDNGASSLELEGREAKQLGSLSREGGIDKAIGKKAQALSLWRRLLSSE
ncbi:hypothetical protein GRJ2_000718000 [Grus japonensis]|uniref:Uncharacterized protein n=1 Tax=Grus japonensis TaxID=30415 RepID=A0ABC9WE54_GRUJA